MLIFDYSYNFYKLSHLFAVPLAFETIKKLLFNAELQRQEIVILNMHLYGAHLF